MRRGVLILVMLSATGASAAGEGPAAPSALNQDDFRLLSRDLASGLNYRMLSPRDAEPGLLQPIQLDWISAPIGTAPALGLDEGLEQPSLPKLRLRTELSSGIGLGAFYSTLPEANYELWGAEASYSLLRGGDRQTALAVRGSFSRLSGLEHLSVDTHGVDLLVSGEFNRFSPYAGIGRLWTRSTAGGMDLEDEAFMAERYFLGASLNFGILTLDLEGDRTGEETSYSIKLDVRF